MWYNIYLSDRALCKSDLFVEYHIFHNLHLSRECDAEYLSRSIRYTKCKILEYGKGNEQTNYYFMFESFLMDSL